MSDGSNPYVEARREWNDRYLDLARSVRNWQLVAGCSIAIVGVLAVGVVWLSERHSVIPYVVEVDKLGWALAAGPATRDSGVLSGDRIVRYHLAAFIRGARSVIADPTAMKRSLDQVYAYTRGEAVTFLDQYYRTRNPFERAKDLLVGVDVTSLLPLSESTWHIRWLETERTLEGKITARTNWEGVLTLRMIPPSDEPSIVANPLGLYVTELNWTRQL